MGEIIVSDALAKLKEEIRLLKAKLAELLQERDDLIYHICPELRAKYAAEIGDAFMMGIVGSARYEKIVA